MIGDSLQVKQMMDFSKSHSPSTTITTSFFDSDSGEEEDDFLRVRRDRISPGFGLRPICSTGSSISPSFGISNSSFDGHEWSARVHETRNGRYDGTALIYKINRIIEENERNIQHAVEVASARVTQLESGTRHLENSMDDLKVCVEYNHGRNGGKLGELESILNEVHLDVKLLLDKQEIAETQLQLLKLQHDRKKPERKTQKLDGQTTLSQQKPSISSNESYHSVPASHTFAQPVPFLSSAYSILPPLNHLPAPPSPQAPLGPSISQPPQQSLPPFLTQALQLASSLPREPYSSTFVHPQALPTPEVLHSPLPPFLSNPQSRYTPSHQKFEPYALSPSYPSSTQQLLQPAECWKEPSTLHSFRVSDQSSIPENNNSVPEHSFFSGFPDHASQNSYDDSASHSEGSLMKSSQNSLRALPYALPTASPLDSESGSNEKVDKASIDDVVEEVTAMGFRRDMVIAAVRKSTQNQEAVDLNTLLDKLMN